MVGSPTTSRESARKTLRALPSIEFCDSQADGVCILRGSAREKETFPRGEKGGSGW